MRLRHPFEWLSAPGQKRALVLFLAIALAVMAGLFVLGEPLTTAAAPQGIVSFELAGELPLARKILESWGHRGRVYAGLNLGLDYLFLVVYAASIGLGCVLVSRSLPPRLGLLSSAGILLSWMQWGAALLDAVENYALIQILLGSGQECWPTVARWCAIPKFVIVGAGLVYVALGVIVAIAARAREKRAP